MSNDKLIKSGTINLHDVIFVIMIVFSVTTILQGLPMMGNINRILISLFLLIIFCVFCKIKIKKLDFFIIFITICLSILSFIYLNGNPIYHINDALYFPCWILIMIYSSNFFDKLKERIDTKESIIEKIVILWNIIVFISFFFSKSYTHHWGEGTYFQSFSNAEHRLAASSIFIIILNGILYLKDYKPKRLIWMIIPIISIYMSGARTYLGILIVIIMGIIFKRSKSFGKFLLKVIPVFVIFVLFLKVTPMWEKILLTFQHETFRNPLATFTNGRSVFWQTQLKAFWNTGFFRHLTGNGYNFVYEVSGLWAHNDFINILLNFGYIGLFLYLYTYVDFIKKYKNYSSNLNLFLLIICIFIWLFNASFNMVYTYMCATLSLPFLLLLFLS